MVLPSCVQYSAAIDSTTQQQHYLEAQQRVALDTDEEVSAQADVGMQLLKQYAYLLLGHYRHPQVCPAL